MPKSWSPCTPGLLQVFHWTRFAWSSAGVISSTMTWTTENPHRRFKSVVAGWKQVTPAAARPGGGGKEKAWGQDSRSDSCCGRTGPSARGRGWDLHAGTHTLPLKCRLTVERVWLLQARFFMEIMWPVLLFMGLVWLRRVNPLYRQHECERANASVSV